VFLSNVDENGFDGANGESVPDGNPLAKPSPLGAGRDDAPNNGIWKWEN